MAMTKPRQPIVIERVAPAVDDGRHPVKRVVGELLVVSADIFKEGHDVLAAAVRLRARGEAEWRVAPLVKRDGDRWTAELVLQENTRYTFTLEAWTDRFGSWVREIERRVAGGQGDLRSELLEGRALIEEAAGAVSAVDAERVRHAVGAFDAAPDQEARLRLILEPGLRTLVARCGAAAGSDTPRPRVRGGGGPPARALRGMVRVLPALPGPRGRPPRDF
jgi:starch synthase (maltosyl-transferring)